MNNLEQHRITKPNLTVAIRIAMVLIVLEALTFNHIITDIFSYPVVYLVINYLYIPIGILTAFLFLLFARYLDNFELKRNYKVCIYLISLIFLADIVFITTDKVLQSLQEPHGEGVLALLDLFDHPYRKLIANCLSISSTLKTILFFILGVILLPAKKKDFVGGLEVLSAFFILYSCFYLVSYGVGVLVTFYRNTSLFTNILLVYWICNICSFLIIAGIGNVFYKANSYNEKNIDMLS